MYKHKFIQAALIALAVFAISACAKKEANQKAEADANEQAHDTNTVTLTKKNFEHTEIKTVKAAIGNLATTLKAAGRVTENANKTAKVSSTLEGRLIKLNVDLNDPVKASDVLALVQTPELLGKPLELKAPIGGVIIDRKGAVGELVGKDTEIFTISDPTDLWVIAEIKERDIGAVIAGQDVTFTVLAYPERKFSGKVVRVGNRLEEKARTLEVRIEANNPEGQLKPGMFADVEITTDVMQGVLIIPDSALQTHEDQQIVFIEREPLKFEKRVVKLGLESQGMVQVFDGVREGENVVTEGSFILKSEMLKGEMGEE